MEKLFQGLFDTGLVSVISVTDFLLCIAVSLVIGLLMAAGYMVVHSEHLSLIQT